MEADFRTPLIDLFHRGEVDRDLRVLAAQGALVPWSFEYLGLLMLLVRDSDVELAASAEATLQAIPRERLGTWLARDDAPGVVREFFAARGIEPLKYAAADDPETGWESSATAAADAVGETEAPAADRREKPVSVLERIAAMTVAERVGLAMKGSREERAILIRDSNKIVSMAVLSSPKVTGSEVEAIAKLTSVSEETLRAIAGNRAWMKNYAVALALVRNAKTPVGLSMRLLARLTDRDLRLLSTDRNVPETLRVAARQKVVVQK